MENNIKGKVRIAAVGDNCMDVYAKEGAAYPGGNPLNVAVYIVRLGGEAAYIGAVGTDENGRLMQEAIRNKGVDISRLHVMEGKTAVTQVEIVDGDRVFGDYDEGVMADFRLEEEDFSFLKGYQLVVSGIWGKAQGQLSRIQELGIPVAFDFATYAGDASVEEIIPHVDYAFFSIDEQEEEEIKSYMEKMWKLGPKIVVVTRGEKGSMAYDGKDFYEYGIIPCDVADTMGAGDSYIAGFLYGAVLNRPVEEAMEMGAKNSSITLQYSGAWQ